jgi:ATP synthase protein I
MKQQLKNHDRLDEAVRIRRERRARWWREGERSMGENLAMMGALGWTIVAPTLAGIFAVRWLDGSSAREYSGRWACSWLD